MAHFKSRLLDDGRLILMGKERGGVLTLAEAGPGGGREDSKFPPMSLKERPLHPVKNSDRTGKKKPFHAALMNKGTWPAARRERLGGVEKERGWSDERARGAYG